MPSKISKSLCNLNPATAPIFLLLQQRVSEESSVFRSSKPNYRYRKERDRSARRGMVGGRGKWSVAKRNPRMGYVQFYQSYPLAISYPWLTLVIGKIGLSQYVYLWLSGVRVDSVLLIKFLDLRFFLLLSHSISSIIHDHP